MNATPFWGAVCLWAASLVSAECFIQRGLLDEARDYLLHKGVIDEKTNITLLPYSGDPNATFTFEIDRETGSEVLHASVTMIRTVDGFKIKESIRLYGGATPGDAIQIKSAMISYLRSESATRLKKYFPVMTRVEVSINEVFLVEVKKIDDNFYEVVGESNQRPMSGTLLTARLARSRDGFFNVISSTSSKK